MTEDPAEAAQTSPWWGVTFAVWYVGGLCLFYSAWREGFAPDFVAGFPGVAGLLTFIGILLPLKWLVLTVWLGVATYLALAAGDRDFDDSMGSLLLRGVAIGLGLSLIAAGLTFLWFVMGIVGGVVAAVFRRASV